MNKVNKINKIIILLLTLCLICNSVVLANDNKSEKNPMATKSEKINVDGAEIELYREFNNNKQALKYLKDNYNDILKIVEVDKEIEKLSNNNWEEYYLLLNTISEWHPQITDEEKTRAIEIEQFFDIYENNGKNKEIKDLAKSIESFDSINSSLSLSNNTRKDELIDQFNILLPNNSNKIGNEADVSIKVSSGINVSKAITYASKYATSPIRPGYDYFSSDCTNFASQILEAGGVKQEVYSSENLGWWHTVTHIEYGNIYQHKHSISFIRADTFAKYMGVSYTTKKHTDFSSQITKGDFIGFDKSSDGDWDHMAFVTDKKTTQSTYNGKKYYDYKVAQHTSNYHAWTSSSTNGWENLEDNGYTYGIIRR